MSRTGPADEQAFTLLEVLLVLTILALVGLAAALRSPDHRDRLELARAGSWLDTTLAQVRAQARREGRARTLELDVAEHRYREPGAGGCCPLPAGVDWSLDSGQARAAFVFLPDGTGSGAVVRMRVRSLSATRRVDPLTGFIRHGVQ